MGKNPLEVVNKVFRHSKCGKIITLEVNGTTYKGKCEFCNIKIEVKAK